MDANKISHLSILNMLKTGVVVHAPDTSILYCNPRACELLDLSEEQMQGRVAMDPLWHFVDSDNNRIPVEQYPISLALQSLKEITDLTFGIVSPNRDECVWVSVNATPFFSESGHLSHISIHFHDITKQRNLDLAYAKQSEKYKSILRGASDGVCILDVNGCIVEASDSWCQMTGYSLKESIGMHVSEWDNKFDTKQLTKLITKLFTKSERIQFETEHKRKDGSSYPVEVSSIPIEINQEKLLICSSRDVSSRKAVEQSFYDTLLRLEETVKAGKVGLWDWNLETNDVYFSKEYKAQIGYSDAEIENTFENWRCRVHPDDLDKTIKVVEKSIETRNKNHETLFRFRHKDGSYRWILSHGSVLTDDDNKPIRMIGSHIDVTDRKHLEEELRQSQKIEAIGQLAGGVAHDFNNQLAGIMGFAEVLKLKIKDENLTNYVEKIITAAENSAELTKQLLTFSRKSSVKHEAMNIHKVIKEVVDLLSWTIDKRVKIETEFLASEDVVMGDDAIAKNLILNIALNARDAMPNGGKFSIQTSVVKHYKPKDSQSIYTLDTNQYIRIDLIDTGSGIEKDLLDKIFEPFFTTKEVGKGTGMGLASVYGAVQQMSGFIEVESELKKGTCFSVFLPLQTDAETIIEETKTIKTTSTNKTILVVDDENSVRELCKAFIHELGHKGFYAEDGQQALQIFKHNKHNIDLVILDMIMPSMTGKDVLAKLKQLDPEVKVVIATGYVETKLLEETMNLQPNKLIYKPFKLAEFTQAINETT